MASFLSEQSDYMSFQAQLISTNIEDKAFKQQSAEDLYWVLGSLGAVYILFMFMFRSLLVGTYALLLILLSYPPAQLIYRELFGISFFTTVNLPATLIVLAIATNHIYVFHEAWKQSEQVTQL